MGTGIKREDKDRDIPYETTFIMKHSKVGIAACFEALRGVWPRGFGDWDPKVWVGAYGVERSNLSLRALSYREKGLIEASIFNSLGSWL